MRSLPSTTASALLALAGVPPSADAQSPSPPAQDVPQAIEALRREHADAIADLRDEIDALAAELETERARAAAPAQSALSAFNPAITVFGNFLYREDDRPVHVDDDPGEPRVDDRFHLREIEIDLRAPIDPWADGVVIASFESESPGEFSAAIEEGYVGLRKLPGLDAAPAGLKLKLGRFRPSFGRTNAIHLHDLPAPTYPLALRRFLGPEGFSADGMSGRFFLPSFGESDVVEATVEVVDGGEIAISPDGDSGDVAALGRVQWFADLAEGRDLEIGVSGWNSNPENRLYGADATYRWRPPVAGRWRSFLVGAELYQADLDASGFDEHPDGFDVWTQYQLDRGLYVGARFGRADDLADASTDTESYGAYVTYETSEFLRFRLGLEHAESEDPLLDGVDTAFLELNFVYGSHPAEPYWVNR